MTRGMRFGLAVLISLLAVLSIPHPLLSAPGGIVTEIIPVEGAPLRIPWASARLVPSSILTYLYIQMHLENISSKPIVAFEVNWKVYNTWGEDVRTTYTGGQSERRIAPGVVVGRSVFDEIAWRMIAPSGGVSKVILQLGRVKFEDGTIWNVDAPAPATTPPPASPPVPSTPSEP